MANERRLGFLTDRKYYESFFMKNDRAFRHMACLLWIVEAVLSYFVIRKVPYTEIDWSTYMQQVECHTKKNIANYSEIGGDTGPIVYPAGHLIFYQVLYHLTDRGRNIRAAQYIFMLLYLANLAVVFRVIYRTKQIPAFVLIFLSVTGYRIHSIFMLRLFNDPVAMLFFYLAIDKLQSKQWIAGCALYSIAVSIKMNILLFSPALFFFLVVSVGFRQTVTYIFMCGILQLVAGAPFLYADWKSYLMRSFDLGRVFMFKWTVNWRFLPEEVFLDKRFHGTLLVGHITVLAFFAYYMWFRGLNGLPFVIKNFTSKGILCVTGHSDPLYALFTANLIGIAFSRSLHYQFYSWYYHQLPFLLFVNYPDIKGIGEVPWAANILKILVIFGIELCWNVYPSTKWSSALLHILHFSILAYLVLNRPYLAKDQRVHDDEKRRNDKLKNAESDEKLEQEKFRYKVLKDNFKLKEVRKAKEAAEKHRILVSEDRPEILFQGLEDAEVLKHPTIRKWIFAKKEREVREVKYLRLIKTDDGTHLSALDEKEEVIPKTAIEKVELMQQAYEMMAEQVKKSNELAETLIQKTGGKKDAEAQCTLITSPVENKQLMSFLKDMRQGYLDAKET